MDRHRSRGIPWPIGGDGMRESWSLTSDGRKAVIYIVTYKRTENSKWEYLPGTYFKLDAEAVASGIMHFVFESKAVIVERNENNVQEDCRFTGGHNFHEYANAPCANCGAHKA